MRGDKRIARNIRIGFLVTAALIIFMVSVFFIGSERKIFAKKNEYKVRLESVSGLAEGNPVKLSGVTIGVVHDIELPRDPKERQVLISLMVDRKYEERIRADSRARLKKLGLLAGDSYIDITPGSPTEPVIEPGSVIPALRQTNVDALITSGEDLVDNFVQISHSLKNILSRVDKGEGLLGEVTTNPASKQRITDTLLVTLNRTNSVLSQVQTGKGLVGKLVYDEAYGEKLTGSLSSAASSLDSIMKHVSGGFDDNSGALPLLLSDPEGKKKVEALLTNLQQASEGLATFSQSLKTGQGLVPRLISDQAYADSSLKEFQGLVAQLHQLAEKLNEGDGTAARIINDPGVYESINDILIGINESKMLRWLIRSRQEKGIAKRYGTEQKNAPAAPAKPAPPANPVVPPPAEVTPPAVPPASQEVAPPASGPPSDTAPTATVPDTTATSPPPP